MTLFCVRPDLGRRRGRRRLGTVWFDRDHNDVIGHQLADTGITRAVIARCGRSEQATTIEGAARAALAGGNGGQIVVLEFRPVGQKYRLTTPPPLFGVLFLAAAKLIDRDHWECVPTH